MLDYPLCIKSYTCHNSPPPGHHLPITFYDYRRIAFSFLGELSDGLFDRSGFCIRNETEDAALSSSAERTVCRRQEEHQEQASAL